MKVKLRLYAEVTEDTSGKVNLKFKNPGYYRQQIAHLKGKKRAVVTIESEGTPRSQQQNRYLWGVVYPILAETTGYSAEEIHEYGKVKFLPPKIIRVGRKAVYITRSTTELTTSDMVEYIDKFIALAGELGAHIPTVEESGYISNTLSPSHNLR